MDDREIERLIADLREMMTKAGFGWAVEQAELGVAHNGTQVERAKALIDAAEGVTVDLAAVELRALDGLSVGDIRFESDDLDADAVDDSGDRALTDGIRRVPPDEIERPEGLARRVLLSELAGQRMVFDELRSSLDGDE
jgi:hypothetical protein